MTGFGENGYNFELVVWLTPSALKPPSAVRATSYWARDTALRTYGVEVPIPQRELYLRGGFEVLSEDTPEQPKSLEQPVALRTSSTGTG
jgi:small-conductance mechanosensitive channel